MYIVFILRICASFFVQRMRKIIPGNFRLYWADLAHTPSLKSREFKEKINFILIATSATVSLKKNHIYSFYFFFLQESQFLRQPVHHSMEGMLHIHCLFIYRLNWLSNKMLVSRNFVHLTKLFIAIRRKWLSNWDDSSLISLVTICSENTVLVN